MVSKYKYYSSVLRNEKGSVVLEVVIVIAIVLALALIFNEQITNFATGLFNRIFDISKLDNVLP